MVQGASNDEFYADWSDPLSAFGQWAQIARECRLPAERKVDFQDNLQDLLRLRRQHMDPDWCRQVNRAIFRTRRKRKWLVQSRAFKEACASVFVCDLPSFERVLERLHSGKSSLDGITADFFF